MSDNEESEWGLPNPSGAGPSGSAPSGPEPLGSVPPPAGPPAGSWQPPRAEPAGAPATPPEPPVAGGAEPIAVSQGPSTGRSRGKVIGAVVGVAALVGAGVFAVTQIGGGGDSGGAASPEEAVQQLIDAIGNEDILGAADLLLPGERNTYRDPLVDLVDELSRLAILDEGADLGDIGGLDIRFDNVEIDTDETNVDDIVNTTFSADVTVSVNGDEVPLGEYLIETAFGGDRPDLDVDETEDSIEDVPLTVVERDGKWFVSLIYTAAEAARAGTDFDIPAADEAIVPVGGGSPEEAVEGFINAIAELDLERIVAGLNPDEAEVLQRYAPLFIDDAQRELNDIDAEVTVENVELSKTEINGSTSVLLDAIELSIEFEDERVDLSLEGRCVTVRGMGETFDSCDDDTMEAFEDVLGELPPEVEDAIETFQEAFDDLEVGGLTVRKVDGSWYVSPIATFTDFGINVLRALDNDELDDIADAVTELMEGVFSGEFDIDDFDDFDMDQLPIGDDSDAFPVDTVPVDTVPDDTVDVTFPDDTVDTSDEEEDALSACFGIFEAEEGLQCVQEGVANGSIDPDDVNPVYLHPECGVAEIHWNFEYYGLSDEDFDAVVAAAAACFAPLIASGEVDEFWLSPEFVHPECLPGGNIYDSDADEAYDEFLDCAYGTSS